MKNEMVFVWLDGKDIAIRNLEDTLSPLKIYSYFPEHSDLKVCCICGHGPFTIFYFQTFSKWNLQKLPIEIDKYQHGRNRLGKPRKILLDTLSTTIFRNK